MEINLSLLSNGFNIISVDNIWIFLLQPPKIIFLLFFIHTPASAFQFVFASSFAHYFAMPLSNFFVIMDYRSHLEPLRFYGSHAFISVVLWVYIKIWLFQAHNMIFIHRPLILMLRNSRLRNGRLSCDHSNLSISALRNVWQGLDLFDWYSVWESSSQSGAHSLARLSKTITYFEKTSHDSEHI